MLIKLKIKSYINYFRSLRRQVQNFKFLSVDYAQWSSIKDWNCVNAEGQHIPWYTYPAIEYLRHLDFSDMNVLELGSGNSTKWWLERSKSVVSVEHDVRWYSKVSNSLFLNESRLTYRLIENKYEYISSVSHDFDVVIIDGVYRKECAEEILRTDCQKIGLIIFDNSDWYPETIKKLRNNLRWVCVDFHGFGPINNYTWTTTVFFNPNFFEKINYRFDLSPVAGVKKIAE